MFKIKRIVFFSSGAVYERLEGAVNPKLCVSPTLPYAISKLASEAYVKHFRKKEVISDYLIVRFFGAYGPHESPRKIYTKMVEQFYFQRCDKFSVRGNGLNLIDAMYVDDAVEGVLRMANASLGDSVIDFCGGHPITIRDLVLRAARVFGIAQPKIVQEGETAEYNRFFADPLPFKQRYGFEPKTSLAEGLRKLAKFLEAKQN
jgi:nucleoside-diphosphate-sugar epimerase